MIYNSDGHVLNDFNWGFEVTGLHSIWHERLSKCNSKAPIKRPFFPLNKYMDLFPAPEILSSAWKKGLSVRLQHKQQGHVEGIVAMNM